MKVLQINSIYKNGSTGRTTFEVEKALLAQGDEALVAYGYGDVDNDSHHLRINSKLSNIIHKVLSRITGLEGYFSVFPTLRLISFIKINSPDVIHLRCLHGDYINLPLLFRYLRTYKGKIFMNLHDCWDLTGHCPYFGECNKWQSQCFDCDKYKKYPKSLFFDTSKKIFRDKKKWYASLNNVTVIAVSKWLSELSKKSILADKKNIYIYNWINQEIFNSSYRISQSEFSIVFVSASWEPGTYRYEMLDKLINFIPKEYKIKIIGIYVGQKSKASNVEYLGYIGDTKELASIYANANVYIHLSIEEAFGKVIAEANACGIPAIVFNVSGCAEIVSSNAGYKVDVGDIDGILKAIEEIHHNGYDYYKASAIDNINRNFNYKINVSQLLELYRNSIN